MNKIQKTNVNLVGVISDTHNLLRPEAVAALKGVDLILHAGDICRPQILEELKTLAPVIAVRGNNDKGDWAADLPVFEAIKIQSVFIYMIHDLKEMDVDPAAGGFKVVVSGHSHKPSLTEGKGVIYLNPGSAGARRFKLPVSVARLKIDGESAVADLIELPV